MSVTKPETKFMPHTDLFSGWTFVSVNENDEVLGIKYVVLEVGGVLDKDKRQALNAQTGKNEYYIEGHIIVKVFTKDQYNKIVSTRTGVSGV